jgi:hypothetical protein
MPLQQRTGEAAESVWWWLHCCMCYMCDPTTCLLLLRPPCTCSLAGVTTASAAAAATASLHCLQPSRLLAQPPAAPNNSYITTYTAKACCCSHLVLSQHAALVPAHCVVVHVNLTQAAHHVQLVVGGAVSVILRALTGMKQQWEHQRQMLGLCVKACQMVWKSKETQR